MIKIEKVKTYGWEETIRKYQYKFRKEMLYEFN